MKANVADQIAEVLPKIRKVTANSLPAAGFAREWVEAERSGMYYLGIPDDRDRKALMLGVFALRQMNSGRPGAALKLLREATRLMKQNST